MKQQKQLRTVTLLVLALAYLCVPVSGQAGGEKANVADISAAGQGVRWVVAAPNAGATLTVAAPDGQVFRREFKSGAAPSFDLTDAQGNRLPDGQYTYELRLTPVLAADVKKELAASRQKGDSEEVSREMRRRGRLPSQPLVKSGTFSIVNGSAVVEGAADDEHPGERTQTPRRRAPYQQPDTLSDAFQLRGGGAIIPARALRGDGLRALRAAFRDNVIADNLIVQGSACVGIDCVSGESFGFDTIRLKENNLRIKFEDTSASTGFPSNDWQLTANDSASGGANKFSIEDVTGVTVPFTLTAGAPTNSVFVASTGKMGLRTATPVLDLHVNTSNTPAFRLEQNNTGGFTAQTWDIGANEANFFVRDLTGGSRLSFRIRPGAPTSSIDISATGAVGIGTASPQATLHVAGTLATDGNTGIGTTTPITKLHVAGRIIAEGNGAGGNNAFGDFGRLNSAGSGEVGLQFGRTAASSGVATIQAAKEGVGSNHMTLQPSGGRVGVGTAAPDQLLSVNGDASKVGGGSWQTFSDERLKRIKGKFNAGLRAVMQLQPVRYEYKPDNALGLASEGEHVGFGAQSLGRVIPEAVKSTEQGYLLVNNDPVIWAMLNAIKEQQMQIEELKAEVRQLRSRRPAAARSRAPKVK